MTVGELKEILNEYPADHDALNVKISGDGALDAVAVVNINDAPRLVLLVGED